MSRFRPSLPVLIGIGVVVLLAICVLGGAAGYLAFGILQNAGPVISEPPAIVIPTPLAEGEGEEPSSETNEPELAPTVTLPGEQPPLSEGTGAIVEIPRARFAVGVDGVLGEWGSIEPTEGAFRVFSNSQWDGTDDLQPLWKLVWDETALYIAVEVTDDVHVQTETGVQTFRGDSLELQLDTQREADLSDALSPDDFQLTFSPGDFQENQPEVFRFRGTDLGQMLPFEGSEITVAAVQTATGYTLEARIPWSDIGVTPAEGLELGGNLNASDNDQPGEAIQEVMMSNNPNRTFGNPTTWGILRLR